MGKGEAEAPSGSPKCRWRVFIEEYKHGAVRLIHERRSAGESLTQMAYELEVGAELLRGWLTKLTARDEITGAPAGIVERRSQIARPAALARQMCRPAYEGYYGMYPLEDVVENAHV